MSVDDWLLIKGVAGECEVVLGAKGEEDQLH